MVLTFSWCMMLLVDHMMCNDGDGNTNGDMNIDVLSYQDIVDDIFSVESE